MNGTPPHNVTTGEIPTTQIVGIVLSVTIGLLVLVLVFVIAFTLGKWKLRDDTFFGMFHNIRRSYDRVGNPANDDPETDEQMRSLALSESSEDGTDEKKDDTEDDYSDESLETQGKAFIPDEDKSKE